MAHRKGFTETALVHKNFIKQLKQFNEKYLNSRIF